MRVDLVNFSGPGPGATASLLAEWRVGAILEAIAVRDPGSGQLWLDIAGQRHAARVASGNTTGPQDGERLQVRVLRTSPVLALETLSAAKPSGSADATVIADALRRYVPRQESPALILANLAWLAQGNDADSLPRPVIEAAARLWQAVPEADELHDPAALASALKRSGVFLEANLATPTARTSADIALDLKALMLSLSRTLQAHGAKPSPTHADPGAHVPVPNATGPLTPLLSTPATLAVVDSPAQQLNELAHQTDGALARMTTTQISNSAADGPTQALLIDLPVRYEDRATILRLRVERDGSRRQERGADAWTVEAAMDLGPIGAMHARVTLAGRRITVQLRAESASIVDALSRRSGELESVLREAGLQIDRVVCLHGMPVGDSGMRAARLLDVRA